MPSTPSAPGSQEPRLLKTRHRLFALGPGLAPEAAPTPTARRDISTRRVRSSSGVYGVFDCGGRWVLIRQGWCRRGGWDATALDAGPSPRAPVVEEQSPGEACASNDFLPVRDSGGRRTGQPVRSGVGCRRKKLVKATGRTFSGPFGSFEQRVPPAAGPASVAHLIACGRRKLARRPRGPPACRPQLWKPAGRCHWNHDMSMLLDSHASHTSRSRMPGVRPEPSRLPTPTCCTVGPDFQVPSNGRRKPNVV